MGQHIKHTALTKPLGGKFHKNEIAFLGAPCSVIQKLTNQIAKDLSTDYRLGYVDAEHNAPETEDLFYRKYTDQISSHSLSFDHKDLSYQFKGLFQDVDGVIVNGNHFVAENQVVLINSKKEDSLHRKLDRLTSVKLFVLDEGMDEPFPFLMDHIEGANNIPVVPISEVETISKLVRSQITEDAVPLLGLVIAGGKSMRMGHDKGAVVYHQKAQREHIADILNDLCDETYMSVSPNSNIATEYPTIEDSFTGLGPYGGILSAFRNNPNVAWFTVACDIPLLSRDTLLELINKRNTAKMATCFHNPETNFPEPLITIWEPRAYQQLLYFLSIGYSCPRKALINSEIEEIQISDSQLLANANTPEELDRLKAIINS